MQNFFSLSSVELFMFLFEIMLFILNYESVE